MSTTCGKWSRGKKVWRKVCKDSQGRKVGGATIRKVSNKYGLRYGILVNIDNAKFFGKYHAESLADAKFIADKKLLAESEGDVEFGCACGG